MTPQEHIDKILSAVREMAADGHLNDPESSIAAGAVEYEAIRLLDIIDFSSPESG